MTNRPVPSVRIPESPEAGPSSGSGSRDPSPRGSRILQGAHGRLSKLMVPGRARSGSGASQSETQVTAYAEDGGITSGRSTPEQRRKTGKAAAASLLASDPKYKKFAAQVDKCLQSFESVNEWADFISFLSRLLKTLQTWAAYTDIPWKLIVSKRLAQCLNPALPSGVHQRALDVYAHIFSTIGVEGLRRDLLIWSSGLFPFFQFASTSVRPQIINIFQNFYLPLGEDLRPATKAILLALLPGMEEETGDFFDKVLVFFRQLSRAVSEGFFLQTVFLVLISSASSRLSGLNYLAKEMQKPPDPSLGIENGLIIRGVAAVLNDENVLVRRNGLDLLLRVLRIHESIFKEATPEDQRMLMRVTIGVVLQREISLSRRVYTWLLGPEDSGDKQMDNYRQHSLELLVSTLESYMETSIASEDANDLLRPFKIFLSLLDRWEVGAILSEQLAIKTLQLMRSAAEIHPEHKQEVIITAIAVYESVEPMIIWRKLYDLVAQSLRAETDDLLTRWILTTIPQKDDEVRNVHVPVLLEYILLSLHENEVRAERIGPTLELCSLLLDAVPSRILGSADGQMDKRSSLASELYSAQGKKSVEEWSRRVLEGVMPNIVKLIFSSTSVGSLKDNIVSCLNLQHSLIDAEAVSLKQLDSLEWLKSLINLLSESSSFIVVEAVVSLALKAGRATLFEPPIDLSAHSTMTTILDNLFSFLRADAAPYHARAVELLWDYNQIAEIHVLETVIASRMSSSNLSIATRTFEAFGVLWNLTEDSMLPGDLFHVPLFKIVDSLGQSGQLKWHAEAFMRNSLGSWPRLLDPLLLRILNAILLVEDSSVSHQHKADLSTSLYLLESLKTIITFGGRPLSRTCQSMDVINSPYTQLVEVVQTHWSANMSYLDLLVLTLLKHIEEREDKSTRADFARQQLQSVALSVLQMLVGHGELSRVAGARIKLGVIQRLSTAVQTGSVLLQPQLLELLRSLLALAPNHNQPRNHRRVESLPEKSNISSPSLVDSAKDFDVLMVDLVNLAILHDETYLVLRQWTEFTLVLVTRLQSRSDLLHELAETFSRQTTAIMLQLDQCYQKQMRTSITDEQPAFYLVVMERLITLSMSLRSNRKSEDGRAQNESGGLLGLMSGVFVNDGPSNEKTPINDDTFFQDYIRSLLITWSVVTKEPVSGPSLPSQDRCFFSIHAKAQGVLERTFKAYPLPLIESMTTVWAENDTNLVDAAIFDCIDMLTPSAQRVVELLSESINHQLKRGSDGTFATMGFLEGYISRLEAPIAVQVWNTLFSFAKDIIASSTTANSRSLSYPTLRCLTILSKIVATTSALEDRRLRRDLQEIYSKLLDAVVGSVARLGDAKAWQRSTAADAELLITDLQTFLADQILPNLRSFLHDADRVAATCATISSTVITPALRQKQRVSPIILRILYEMTRIPSATKAWRLPVGEAFNDARFFKQSAEEADFWRPLICALMDNDKDRLVEMLARITAAPSANIFANREQETITRSMNLRRLSFVLFAAETNHFLTDLPAMQEALVDVLRTSVISARVHSEVYRCLRVLMCRFSAQHLTNFWPVILAELFRVFEGIMDEIPAPESEPLHLILAACKFLDLLLVIQSEDFQLHQWMFVSDTTDAVYPPEDYTPEAIMDRLAEIMFEHAHAGDDAPALAIGSEGSSALRRPRLAAVQTIVSLSQLRPFFSRASIDTYEGVYSNDGVDWEAVEEGLKDEIFDERV
ncbi:Dopey, N-terminal-domain-containing protein [Kockovaella imperatae]|uniref:Dopey, N-terminal-domain-containing protein n=1 Tax=Kockovaella imperatae TaxID=4999 RepID=A0A1Y1UE39_9TREE|nr:Dopey, N-terminal-domain-containing protein [Kockovaella imperatae]ORX36308.1 Dopey, N-terminal-domain-containing protein [Kockovaella imperatae]